MPLSTIDNTGLSQSQILSAINMPTGSVIQTITASAPVFSTSSGSPVATGLSASITPLFSTSKIIVQVFWNPYTPISAEIDGYLYRNGSNVFGYWIDQYGSASQIISTSSAFYTESPGSTSTITYATYLKTSTGTVNTGGSSQNQQMLIMEIR